MKRILPALFAVAVLFTAARAAFGSEEPPVKITDVSLVGTIVGENITFSLTLTAEPNKRHPAFALVSGDLVLDKAVEAGGRHEIEHDPVTKTYSITWRGSSTRTIDVSFACRPQVLEDRVWREAVFSIPAAHARELKVICDRTDLEILFPGAVRFDRTVADDVLTATALLGPGRPFIVRWKPQVQQLESKLVMSSEANTIVTAGTGALRLSSLFVFNVSQGKLKTIEFTVPDALSITQVRSPLLQDWHMTDVEGTQVLVVTLSRPETAQHAIEVSSELVLGNLPTETVLPVIEPHGVIRSSGHIALGTDSALRLVVTEPRGISQVDAASFPRMVLTRDKPRPLPRANTFFYTYAAVPYHMKLAVEDIVPSFDATERLTLTAREENMTITCDIELEVRDAPLRSAVFTLDKSLMVSKAEGAQVADYAVRDMPGTDRQEVEVHFASPVMGRTKIATKLELADSALDTLTRISAVSVAGAKSERGWLAVATEQGIELDAPKVVELREVHTDSLPMRVLGAQHAYRFRKGDWKIEFLARKKKPSARAEAFHLVSIGDGIAYGSVAMTYFIAGAPLDELRFKIPRELRNVEFVSKDIRRWKQTDDMWIVQLQRKVIGDYALLVTYNQQLEADGIVHAGGVRAEGLDSETGYICVASNLNLALAQASEVGAGVLEIDRSEVPDAYLMQINAPLLKTYKYIKRHDGIRLAAKQFDAGQLVPAVIEQTELDTQINLNNEGEAQSRTTVTFKVKNSRNQFLSLSMPKDVNVWSVQVLSEGGSRRVAASFDKENGLLMVPLDRRRNPNEPLTVEVVYARTHGALDLSGHMMLRAPASQTRSTYTRWRVSVPEDWAVYPEAAGMPASPREDDEGRGLAGLTAALFDGAARAVPSVILAGIVVALIAAVAIFLSRSASTSVSRAVATVSVAALIGVVGLVIAITVNNRLSWQHCDLTSVTFTQAVDLDEASPLEIDFSIVPEWRRHATVPGAIILPIVSLLLIGVAVANKRLRVASAAAALTGIVYALALFPDLWPFLVHLIAWVLPAIAAVLIVRIVHVSQARAEQARALVASLVLAFVALTPRTADASDKEYPEPPIDSVQYTLKAEKDHVAIDLALHIDHDERLQVKLLDGSAILLSPDEERRVYKIDNSSGAYVMEVYRPKKRDITLQFLAPLEKGGDDGLRTLQLPIPKALRNSVVLTIPEVSLDVESPTAIRLVKEEADGVTTATAVFGPTDRCVFMWKPRARMARLEKTSFYAEVTSLARLGLGVAECRHRIQFQVAQGELKLIKCRMPKGMTVTAVEGAEIGTWRFDPAAGELEAYLTKPATGQFVITVLTQAPVETVPYTLSIAVPEILAAERQRGAIGIATTPAVYIESEGQPSRMNIEDFVRDAAALIAASGATASDLRGAYRVQGASDAVTVTSYEVKPEIRANEDASFAVEDDRLIYNGDLTITISKTGVFSLTLALPKDYDVDSLVASNMSHWDDRVDGATRFVQVHFGQKVLGAVSLKLNMSRAIAEMPATIAMPRVEVQQSTKHAGALRVSSERGVRLSVGSRTSVSEVNPLELGIRTQGTLAFRLLATDWELTLKTEVVETRTVVDFLHIAHVSEGLVRHTDYLNYLLYNAGTRYFDVRVPNDALGLEITGRDIANVRQVEPGGAIWRAELSRKWFNPGVPYRLTVRYESRFNLAERRLALEPAKAVGVDLQRGYIAAYATDKVEITPVKSGGELQPADARSIARSFGAGDLSGAAFCYTSSTPEYDLVFDAVRHDAASLLEARVQSLSVTSVVAESGDSINRVDIDLLVGGKRHLETVLPAGAEIWSLLTDGRVSVPSYRTDGDASVLMLPLGQSVSSELPVKLEFVYVCPAPEGWLHGRPHFVGPKFDLPLKDMQWRLYLPEGYEYDDFEGTLAVDKSTVHEPTVIAYSPDLYDTRLQNQVNRENEQAASLLQKGSDFAQRGQQMQAKQAFENAYNLSLNKKDLNEDARIQLHKLNRQQAVVGLVGRRSKLRPGQAQSPAAVNQQPAQEEQQMDVEQIQRIESSLGKDDSENLQMIADRMIGQQEAAAGFAWPLKVEPAPRGRLINLTGSIQVEPNADMSVDFVAKKKARTSMGNLFAAFVLAGVLFALGQLARRSSAARAEASR